MQTLIGPSNRLLNVNLTSGRITTTQISKDTRHLYLGGKGVGLRLLYERLTPGIAPLGPDNLLVLMMGPLLGTGAPCTSRFAALTKSPLTGIIASASCGGPWGMAFKTAGYDGLIITGRADTPVRLVIDDNNAEIRPAHTLWGLDTQATQQALALDRRDGALVIGPAGEHLVRYANVASGTRFLGRGGFGAVMGSKHLKAIVARGGAYKIIPHDKVGFQAVRQQAVAYINSNVLTSTEYRRQGTVANLARCNQGGILPVRNFQGGSDPRAVALTGPEWQKAYQIKPHACRSCAILCGHQGTYPDGKQHKIPEYETISLLGPNLEIFDRELITGWSEQCDKLGLDTISVGATLSYAMEASEKGLFATPLRFGKPEGIAATLAAIAYRRGFGNELANGTRWLSEKYGGQEFAIQVKGMELPGYDPRGSWGQGLSYATANRGGCHLSATLFAQEVFFGYLKPHTTHAKAEFVLYLNKLNTTINALQTCVFTAFAYLLEPPHIKMTPPSVMGFFMQNFPNLAIAMLDIRTYSRLFETVTGIQMTQRALLKAGQRIHTLERYMNTREGITRADDTLPARFLTQPRTCDPHHHTVDLAPMLARYYKLAGYDAQGTPTPQTLAHLGIKT